MGETTNIRVRYQETDQMGIVYYANYYVWFEVGRTEFFRNKGFSYRSFEAKGIYLPVTKSVCNYFEPARYDDNITIKTAITKFTSVQIVFKYSLLRNDKVIAEGETYHAFVNLSGKPIRIDKEEPELYTNIREVVE